MTGGCQEQLKSFKPRHGFFIGIDSDGCAFDTMELKHKECFCPNFIEHFHCQCVSKYAREVWDFVNLYSKWRGCNRWNAVVYALDLLQDRDEVRRRGARIPDGKALKAFIAANKTLSDDSLGRAIAAATNPGDRKDLEEALAYSKAVNASVKRIVHGVPPFPLVRESLEKARARADVIVVSQTPTDALVREWEEHRLCEFVDIIAGQECGSKSEHIALGAGTKYPAGHVLMIGDALGDYRAARDNNALFFPINPMSEEASWSRFHDEALERFFAGNYAGAYQDGLVKEFEELLSGTPPWKR